MSGDKPPPNPSSGEIVHPSQRPYLRMAPRHSYYDRQSEQFQRFIDTYLYIGNAEEAARLVGLDPQHGRSYLLIREVKEALRERELEVRDEEMTEEGWLKRLQSIADTSQNDQSRLIALKMIADYQGWEKKKGEASTDKPDKLTKIFERHHDKQLGELALLRPVRPEKK